MKSPIFCKPTSNISAIVSETLSNLNFEVRIMAKGCGYESFHPVREDGTDIGPTKVTVGLTTKSVSEYDAMLEGDLKSFQEFRALFKTTFDTFPPTDNHLLIIEAKLNSKLLVEWTKSKKIGSGNLFFNPQNQKYLTKVAVINGGSESEEFVKMLNSPNDPPAHFSECFRQLKAARINVFYKLWTSNESFQDLFHLVKKESEDLKIEIEQNKKESEDLKIEMERLHNELAIIKQRLKISD